MNDFPRLVRDSIIAFHSLVDFFPSFAPPGPWARREENNRSPSRPLINYHRVTPSIMAWARALSCNKLITRTLLSRVTIIMTRPSLCIFRPSLRTAHSPHSCYLVGLINSPIFHSYEHNEYRIIRYTTPSSLSWQHLPCITWYKASTQLLF